MGVTHGGGAPNSAQKVTRTCGSLFLGVDELPDAFCRSSMSVEGERRSRRGKGKRDTREKREMRAETEREKSKRREEKRN